jgi:two-component system sensor histidine kinase AtoS
MQPRRIRLIIIIPALMLLLTLGVGIVNYEITSVILEHHADRTVRAVLDDLSVRILAWSLIITFVALLFGLALAYSIVRPIKTITQTAQDITRGQIDRKVTLPTQPPEIGELGSSFNSVVDYLNALFEERNRYVLESFSGGLITTDTRGTITAMNSAAESLLQVSAKHVVGKSLLGILRNYDPPAVALIAIIEDVLAYPARGGVTSRPVTFPPVRPPARAGAGSTGESAAPTALLVNTSVMRDLSGKPFGCIINFRDLSKIQAFHARMQRADNLAALGSFAMGIAHELRNPLAAIKGMTQLLYSDTVESTAARDYCNRIIREVERLDRVIQAIHDFSHQEVSPPRECDLNAIAHDALELARNRSAEAGGARAGKRGAPRDLPPDHIGAGVQAGSRGGLGQGITIVEQYAELPRCRLQPERTMQALLNIIINAFEATAPGETVALRSRLDGSARDGRSLALEITNTGSRIGKADIEKIFDPFYTTKPDGTGLGLPIAYQIVTYNNGEISVKSDADGTTFIVRFPPAESVGS